jgi:hypothetical protein
MFRPAKSLETRISLRIERLANFSGLVIQIEINAHDKFRFVCSKGN